MQTLKNYIHILAPVFVLEDLMSHASRLIFRRYFSSIAYILGGITLLLHTPVSVTLKEILPYETVFRGSFLIFAAVSLILSMLDYYFYSAVARTQKKEKNLFFFCKVFIANKSDATYGWVNSDLGRRVHGRLNISREEIVIFINSERTIIAPTDIAEKISQQNSEQNSFFQYIDTLFNTDEAYRSFLFVRGVQQKDLLHVLGWIAEEFERQIQNERWWSKEKLAKIPGIGKNWSYGQTFVLDKYGEDITDRQISFIRGYSSMIEEEVNQLEAILSKTREADAIMVSNDEAGKMSVLSLLAKRISDGTVTPYLEHKRIFIVNTNSLIDNTAEKINFEIEFSNLLVQAINAGNVIVVFPHFPSFLQSTRALGSDPISVMLPYLQSDRLQFIALSSVSEFHEVIETNDVLMQQLEVVQIKDKDDESVLEILENEIKTIEQGAGLFFTYQSLVAITQSAKRYFSSTIIADKAISILLEFVPFAQERGIKIITTHEVELLVERKTGIPMGEVKDAERQKLLNLENLLHQKVIGQDEAVRAIASALKRSRTGIRNPEKPIGSFLFLGPTGVGKTETTKALASVFFTANTNTNKNKDPQIERLDMSEYKSSDSLSRLIGFAGDKKSGILSSLLRQKPYGVLLLDEFEKAHPDVHNLFLQILDEGFFSDVEGKQVNARNLIIIATSNAGSELIWDLVRNNKNLENEKQTVIDAIIEQQIFRPELLNRFDGVILFHPLAEADIKKIAQLMLGKLQQRLKERGMNLIINDALLTYLLTQGQDPQFGARPMNRAITEFVEGKISEHMIVGDIHNGSTIEFVELAGKGLDIYIKA